MALCAALMSGALLFSLSASADAATRTAPAAKATRCSITKVGRSLGPTYVESLVVTGVNCVAGEKLIKAYNACRLKHGGAKGKCTNGVDGYRFKELRTSSPIQFIAKVTSTKGRDSVVFTYSEDT